MTERECGRVGKPVQVRMAWMRRVPVFEAKESGDVSLVLLSNDECIAIVRSEAVGDFGGTGLMFVGQGFERAGLPLMSQLVHLSFDPQGQGVIIGQSPQFRIVGQNDFRTTVSRLSTSGLKKAKLQASSSWMPVPRWFRSRSVTVTST